MSEESAKRQKAKHAYLTATGEQTREMLEAVGIYYKDLATDEEFEFPIPNAVAGTPLAMLAVFGAKTLATNEASQVRNGTSDSDGSEVDGIMARFALIESGVWREKSEGGVGAKVDRDALATAIVEAQKALGHDRDWQAIREKLDDDGAFFRKARKATDVSEIYDRLVGKQAKPIDSSELF